MFQLQCFRKVKDKMASRFAAINLIKHLVKITDMSYWVHTDHEIVMLRLVTGKFTLYPLITRN